MEESIPNQMICPHCRSICNAEQKIVRGFHISSWAMQSTCGKCTKLSFHCLACQKALKRWDGVLRHKVTQTHLGKLPNLMDGINGADDYISLLPNDNADNGMINDNEEVEESGTDVETDKDDWLLRLGKNNPTIGTPVLSLSDLKDSAGFDKNSSSPRYYWEEYQKPGLGLKHLVAKAFELGNANDITDAEAKFSITFCNLLLKLSKHERKMLSECMVAAVNSKDKELNIFEKTRVPTSTNDFNKIYLTGANAIISNLPHPTPNTTKDRTHAYTTLTDVIANMLAEGTPVEQFHFSANLCLQPEHLCNDQSKPTVSSSRAGLELYLELTQGETENAIDSGKPFVLKLWYKEWRDDFDPFNTKSSRSQVWTNTNTICPPQQESRGRNTFFMAIGAKGTDHSEIEHFFAEELNVLSTDGMSAYHGGLRKIIRLKVGKMLTCIDRPEKTATYRCGDHNGTFSRTWGHAANVDGFCRDNHLPSCPQCRKKRLRMQLRMSNDSLETIIEDGFSTSSSCSDGSSASGGDDESRSANSNGTSRNSSGSSLQSTTTRHPKRVPLCRMPSAPCTNNICSNWQLLDPSFTSAAPTDYPIIFDQRAGAPSAPTGREITIGVPAREVRLVAVQLTIPWLKNAIVFAHHNLKTKIPGGRRNKRYWTKAAATAFLRTCGVVNSLINAVYVSAKKGDDSPPTSYVESRHRLGAMSLCTNAHNIPWACQKQL